MLNSQQLSKTTQAVKNSQLVSATTQDADSQKELPENIFERSLSTSPFRSLPPSRRNSKVGLPATKRTGRSMSVASNGSMSSLNLISAYYNTEDFVAPVLDTTAEILTDPGIDLDEVTVVFCECEDHACRSKHKSTEKISNYPQRPGSLLGSRKKSRSFICNSLMGAFDNCACLEEAETEEHTESSPPVSPQDGKTINFYSFADVVNGENALEKFNSQPMSEYLC